MGKRVLEERVFEAEIVGARAKPGARRTVTVNRMESPLGWLRSRGHVSRRQYEAGERLRLDYENAQLAPRVTMAWDAAPVQRGRGGSASAPEAPMGQIEARRRFDAAMTQAGKGLADVWWRIVCAGEGMREAESALGWPARSGKLVLTLALDRIADYYRIP